MISNIFSRSCMFCYNVFLFNYSKTMGLKSATTKLVALIIAIKDNRAISVDKTTGQFTVSVFAKENNLSVLVFPTLSSYSYYI